jgi:phosphohistidine phosphatase
MMESTVEVIAVDIFLMQHGEAASEAENPDRPLTDAGRAAVQRVAARAEAAGVHVGPCVHSGKLRAEQTARLLVTHLGADVSVESRAGLSPNDPVAPVAEWVRQMTQHRALALVGHLPFLDRLASLLVAGDEDAQVVSFRMGGLVKLEPKADRDGFSVAWVLTPDLS